MVQANLNGQTKTNNDYPCFLHPGQVVLAYKSRCLTLKVSKKNILGWENRVTSNTATENSHNYPPVFLLLLYTHAKRSALLNC